ncbi:hypothetical protein M758_UG165600 [Ceratodon purpureus]|nr:hypothetical protein M758_UG165600 [Ceratodon purpureus]
MAADDLLLYLFLFFLLSCSSMRTDRYEEKEVSTKGEHSQEQM